MLDVPDLMIRAVQQYVAILWTDRRFDNYAHAHENCIRLVIKLYRVACNFLWICVILQRARKKKGVDSGQNVNSVVAAADFGAGVASAPDKAATFTQRPNVNNTDADEAVLSNATSVLSGFSFVCILVRCTLTAITWDANCLCTALES